MTFHRRLSRVLIAIVWACLIILGCQRAPEYLPEPDATPTPTEIPGGLLEPGEETHPCAGLAGSLEVQVLVGPSEAVGMAPVALGSIPFSVADQGGVYAIEGGGPLKFDEQVLQEVWGTYTVSFDADTELSGQCEALNDWEELRMVLVMTGEQMVTVNAEGFQGEYPWSGTQEISAIFPVEEGVSLTGEGWTLILHLAP